MYSFIQILVVEDEICYRDISFTLWQRSSNCLER